MPILWRTYATVCLTAAVLLPALPAWAHKSSDAYLSFTVEGEALRQRLDVGLRDLDRALDLDADTDGRLTWREVRSRWGEIERLADASVQAAVGDRACEPGPFGPARLVDHGDGTYAVLERPLRCPPSAAALTVDYRLFETLDAGHRGLVRVVDGAGGPGGATVLVPGAGPQPVGAAPGGADRPHGLRAFLGFVAEGMHHIAIGLDHILFLASLLMVAVWRREGSGWVPRSDRRGAWIETLQLVTAFTLAHSVTLALAASGLVDPPSRWVESLIALSVVLAALDNLRPFLPGPRWRMAAVFGLVHGLGFAGPLQDLGLRGGELVMPLLGFNLGVELGQLALVALLLPLMVAARGSPFYRLAVVRGGSVAVAALATVWVLERSLEVGLTG